MLNTVRTSFLLAALTGLFMAVGLVVGGTTGMLLALGVAMAINVFGYWNSDRMVLRLQNAHLLERRQSPELFDLAGSLAKRAGIPMPALYMIETDQPNAFATGRNPENAAIAVSSGLLKMLERDELAGVIAHEMGHIRSRDTLVMTLTATLAGAISMLAQFGLFFGGRSGNSPLGPLGSLAAIIVAPVAAVLVQLAVSRTREYEADRDGAEISGQPLALASALRKISRASRQLRNPHASRAPGMAHLFIVNPLAGGSADKLFATHPSVENRVAQLEALARQMGASAPSPDPGRPAQRPRRASPPGNTRGAGWRIPSAGARSGHRPGPWG